MTRSTWTEPVLRVRRGQRTGCTTSIPSAVTTADPSCLFVDPNQTSGRNSEGGPPGCANASSNVNLYDTTNSTYGAPFEPIPTSDSALATLGRAERVPLLGTDRDLLLRHVGLAGYADDERVQPKHHLAELRACPAGEARPTRK